MDSLEFNKAIAAVLVAGLAFMGSGLVADMLVHPTRLKESAIKIEGVAAPEAAADSGGGGPGAIAPLLASASPQNGEASAKKLCASCHSFTEGGAAGVGPNLYGVVGGPHAHMQGYSYSTAMQGKPGKWDFDELNQWLYKPAAFVPGTKMGFAGIKDDKTRADVIDYLHTLAKDPVPLPAAAAATTTAPPAQSGNSTSGSGGGKSPPEQKTQTGAAAGSTQPQGNQGGAPPK